MNFEKERKLETAEIVNPEKERSYEIKNTEPAVEVREGKGGSERLGDAKGRYTAGKPGTAAPGKPEGFRELGLASLGRMKKEEREKRLEEIRKNPFLLSHFIDKNFNEKIFTRYGKELLEEAYKKRGVETEIRPGSPSEDVAGTDYYVRFIVNNPAMRSYMKPLRIDLKTMRGGKDRTNEPVNIRLKQTDKNGRWINSNYLNPDVKTEQYCLQRINCGLSDEQLFDQLVSGKKAEDIAHNGVALNFVSLDRMRELIRERTGYTDEDLGMLCDKMRGYIYWSVVRKGDPGVRPAPLPHPSAKIFDVGNKIKMTLPVDSLAPGAYIETTYDKKANKTMSKLVFGDNFLEDPALTGSGPFQTLRKKFPGNTKAW